MRNAWELLKTRQILYPVSLTVYNPAGQEVAAIINTEQRAAGPHTVQWNAANLPSGVYFYRLQAPQVTETKKLVLIK